MYHDAAIGRIPDRGVSPVVGAVCLTAVTAVLAAVVRTAALGATPQASTPPAMSASFGATAEPACEVTLVHRGGDSIDPEAIELFVRIWNESLEWQPPVPFFSARGFESGPTGAFNSATTDTWEAGETASFRVAGTNAPKLRASETVAVRISVDERSVSTVETTV